MRSAIYSFFQKKLTRTNAVGRTSSSWSAVTRELIKRTFRPLSHFSFVAYFFGAVVLFGGLGVWLELYSYLVLTPATHEPAHPLASLRTALITFFPALAGSACMQMIWAEQYQKFLRAFAVIALLILAAFALMITPKEVGHGTAINIGVACSIFALWTWVVANAKQQDLLDADAPLGNKNPNAKLAGNLDGFEV